MRSEASKLSDWEGNYEKYKFCNFPLKLLEARQPGQLPTARWSDLQVERWSDGLIPVVRWSFFGNLTIHVQDFIVRSSACSYVFVLSPENGGQLN